MTIVFREGILFNMYSHYAAGSAVAAKEPGRDKFDFYVDYRGSEPKPPTNLEDPYIPTENLLKDAKFFAAAHPSARFAVLRIWSAPHFWPVVLGLEERKGCSFLDGNNRHWGFKFVPKDAAYSESAIHHLAGTRLARYLRQLKKYVLHRRDLFIVMGEDEEHLRKVATAVTFAVQTRPWRLEIDLWKSFINVKLDFLEKLDRQWLD